MEEEGLILNLHGELPSQALDDTCVWNAEIKFLPQLFELHRRFPKLRIILEHATTRAAVDAVKACGDTVGCTITAHHLTLTVDDWAGDGLQFCKPVAKLPDDREALREIIRQGHPRFFLGSDSAPHPINRKLPNSPGTCCAAGIYTSVHLLPILATIFESALPPPSSFDQERKILSPIPLDRLSSFVSQFGRNFHQLKQPKSPRRVQLIQNPSSSSSIDSSFQIEKSFNYVYSNQDGSGQFNTQLVPFWYGRTLNWRISD